MQTCAAADPYAHYDPAMARRLDGAWGRVDAVLNERIAARVEPGAPVLDVGCGFGTLAAKLRATGLRATGLDSWRAGLEEAQRRQPHGRLVCGDAIAVPLRAGAVATVTLKDALHHLADEVPLDALFDEFRRLGVRRVVVSDPNPNPILRIARRLIGHVDPTCSPEAARELFERHGYRVTELAYELLFSLPLSGGYVGPVLLPRWRWLWSALLGLERAVDAIVCRIGLGRWLCWRYRLVAVR